MHIECLPAQGQKVLSMLRKIIHNRCFILAGGTALSLQIGHRISVDLDFFTGTLFSSDELYREIEKEGLNPIVQQEEKGTLTTLVNGIKISMFHYPHPFIDKKIEWKGIAIAGVIDIAAMKVIAISQRGAKRDFIDLYFILQDIPFQKIAENMVQRYGLNRVNPVVIGKSLVYFSDADIDVEPQYCKKTSPAWENIKKFFNKNVQQMVLDIQGIKQDYLQKVNNIDQVEKSIELDL